MSTERKFKKGDVVILNSGGPQMTVTKVLENNFSVNCQFFNGSELVTMSFSDDVLKKV